MSRITLDAGLFRLVVRALRRDQESGLAVRGEIADELEQDVKPEQEVLSCETCTQHLTALTNVPTTAYENSVHGLLERVSTLEETVELLVSTSQVLMDKTFPNVAKSCTTPSAITNFQGD